MTGHASGFVQTKPQTTTFHFLIHICHLIPRRTWLVDDKTNAQRKNKFDYVLYLCLWVLSSISLTCSKLKKGHSLAFKSTIIPCNNVCEFSWSIDSAWAWWLDSRLNCDIVWEMGWEENVLELGVSAEIRVSVWSCGTGEVGWGIFRATNWTNWSSDFSDIGRWDSCWSIFDVFTRCAGVGAGILLDENARLDDTGSVKGTSGRSEGGRRWALDVTVVTFNLKLCSI